MSSESDETSVLKTYPDNQSSQSPYMLAIQEKINGESTFSNPYFNNFISAAQLNSFQPFLSKNKHKDYIEKEEELARIKKIKQIQAKYEYKHNLLNRVCLVQW